MLPTVITFYSYKGGVGRTQALANVAVVLANEGYRIIVVDLDLESPGLHSFFSPAKELTRRFSDKDFEHAPGLLEYLEECQAQPSEAPAVSHRLVDCTHEALLQTGGSLRLLPAGRLDTTYPTRVSAFSWERFYAEQRGAECIEYLREQLCCADADFVLIDSRTGVTDVGAVCTFQLPDLVVVLFALHRQGIEGARRVGAAIAQSRDQLGSADAVKRRRSVLFLPTRVAEEAPSDRRDEWISNATDALHHYGRVLHRTGERIPHSLQVAYGEQIVTFPQSDDHLSVAYRKLAKVLLGELGREDSAQAQPPDPISLPTASAVRAQLVQVQQVYSLLHDEFAHISPERSTISSVLGWAQRLVQIPVRLNGALDRLDRQVQQLLDLVSQPIELPPRGHPDTLQDWKALIERYSLAVERDIATYRETVAADARRRLMQAADDDVQAVNKLWPEVQVILDQEPHRDALLSHLSRFEQQLNQSSLRQLLCKNQLEQSHFELRGFSISAMQRWLDERLEKLEEDASLEQALEAVLLNLLRLRVTTVTLPTAIHWTRYDLLCLHAEQDLEPLSERSRDQQYFQEIGQYLWRAVWSNCFAVQPGEALSFDPPAGASCKMQLERLSEQALDLIATECARGLIGHASANAWPSVGQFLVDQQSNVVVRRALHLVRDTADPPVCRRLLALWLCDTHPALEQRLFADYLNALIKLDESPRALLALAALLGETPEIDSREDRHLFDGVYVHAVVALIVGGVLDTVERLLNNLSFRGRLEQIRAGHLIIEILACGFVVQLPPTTFLGTTLRRHALYNGDFSGGVQQAVRRHLENLEKDLYIPSEQADELKTLIDKARAATSPHLFGHQRFQHEFRELFDSKLDALLDDSRPKEKILTEVTSLDADEWYTTTVRSLVSGGRMAKNRSPDDGERRAIVLAFNDARRCLMELANRCPSTGGFSLSQQLDVSKTAAEARLTLCQAVTAQPSDPLLSTVQRLL